MAKKTRRPQNAAAPNEDFAIAIMAAGKGTRLKSKHPKVLHAIAGKPLLQHVIEAAKRVVPGSKIYAIIGHEAERVKQAVAETGVNFILQQEQRGTGHAIMCARDALAQYGNVIVLSGDVPLIRPETIARLCRIHTEKHAAMTILTAVPANPHGYGRILRRPGSKTAEVAGIVEQSALTGKQLKITEINSGIYAFRTTALLAQLDHLKTDNAHHEYYLTDVAGLLVKARDRVLALEADDAEEVLGVNTRAELARLDGLLRARKAAALMANGVTIFRPETCTIDSSVEIGEDTVLDPFAQVLGKTKIGADCRIGSFSVLRDCELGDAVEVRPGCIVTESKVHSQAVLGPYAHLRPGTEVGERAHVGNFVETKKTRLGRGSKANHLTYLGDAEIGENVNVGAGTITCNYDGVFKHTTVIEDGAFIGSDATLVAPIRIGARSYIGAGSCITEDVPPDSLAIARGQQTTKPDWARKKREAQAAAKSK